MIQRDKGHVLNFIKNCSMAFFKFCGIINMVFKNPSINSQTDTSEFNNDFCYHCNIEKVRFLFWVCFFVFAFPTI